MKNSKLVKAIRTLNAWELRHLSDFVHSPFHNKHDRLTALMDLIVAAAPGYDGPELERKAAYGFLWEGAKWDEQKFKDLMSLAMKTFKAFLTYYRLRRDEYTQGMALLEALQERSLDGEWDKAREAMERTARDQPGQLQEHSLRHLRIHEAHINYQGVVKDRKADDSLPQAVRLLDDYFLVYRFKLAVEMANRRNVIGQEYEVGMLAPLMAYLQAHPEAVAANLGLRIYLLLYQLLTEADAEEAFAELLGILQAGIGELHVVERREIYGYAFNFCIQRINRGQAAYLSGLLDLYARALADETLMSEGWLSQWDYKNIVSAALKAQRFDWCQAFIDKYTERIAPADRENAHTYNLASLHLEQGDYRQTLKLLQHVEFSDQFYHLGAKVMLLKVYYELQEQEALLHLCETFRMYLKRNADLSKYHQTTNMNLIAVTRKLADLQSRWPDLGRKEREVGMTKIRTMMEEKGNVAQKGWLLQKLAAFAG